MSAVDIIVVIDQTPFIQEYEANPGQDMVVNVEGLLLTRMKMIAANPYVVAGQATSNLVVNARPRDLVRWYESPLSPSSEYCMVIRDILPLEPSKWAQNMKNYAGSGEPVDYCTTKTSYEFSAYYARQQLFGQSGPVDFTEAEVLSNAVIGSKLNYNFDLVLIKQVQGEPKLVRTYRYDPAINIVG